MDLEVVMHFFAKNPPSILFLGALLLVLVGQGDFAYDFLIAGVFLQVLWLVLRKVRF